MNRFYRFKNLTSEYVNDGYNGEGGHFKITDKLTGRTVTDRNAKSHKDAIRNVRTSGW